MVVSEFRIIAPGYDDVTFCDAELEELKSLRILGISLDSKFTFETLLREVVGKAVRSLRVVRRAGELFDWPHVLKSCLDEYILSSLDYCAPVWKSRRCLIWVCRIVLFADGKTLCEGAPCYLGHRRRVSALCLLYTI